ncbi:hypothetical protein DERF_000264 [Dermatophagoides farinae]|uniref:Uncharacterized protein n=1 Tax=Dermatophagoides farinae TaxID=6954 RepID=A0A922I9L7_DERFA|nr:hypothetical protein DERF_000264 [Dermatophagoides farinae]
MTQQNAEVTGRSCRNDNSNTASVVFVCRVRGSDSGHASISTVMTDFVFATNEEDA